MDGLKEFKEWKAEIYQTTLELGGGVLGYNVGATLLTGLGFAIGGPVIGSIAWEIGRFAGIAGGLYFGKRVAKKIYPGIIEKNRENLLEGEKNNVLEEIQKGNGSWREEWITKHPEESYEIFRETGKETLEGYQCDTEQE